MATICYGVACFLQRDFAIYWQPVPDGFPFRQPLAFVSVGLLVLSGAGLFFSAARRPAAIVQTALFLACFAAYCSVSFAIVVGAVTIWTRMSPEAAKRLRFGPAPAQAILRWGLRIIGRLAIPATRIGGSMSTEHR